MSRRFCVRRREPSSKDELLRLTRQSNWREVLATECATSEVFPTDAMVQHVAKLLRVWFVESSWGVCARCCALVFRSLRLESLSLEPEGNVYPSCHFCEAGYVLPCPTDVPAALVGLSRAEVIALRPLCLHQGNPEQLCPPTPWRPFGIVVEHALCDRTNRGAARKRSRTYSRRVRLLNVVWRNRVQGMGRRARRL